MKTSSSSFELFGIQFAPLLIPFERRLQTLAVFFWISSFLFMGGICSTFFIFLVFTQYRWISILYLTWLVYDWNTPYNGGRKSQNCFTRKWWIWRYFRRFFPIELVKTSELSPEKSYILCSHPHGVLCAGAFCTFATDAVDFKENFPGLDPRLLTLRGNFASPIYRDFMLSTGSVASTKQAMEALLKDKKGVASVLVPGGALEALNADPNQIRLVLNRRKGFIKLALRFGSDLVPTFSFGETFIYDQVQTYGTWLRTFQTVAEKWIGFVPVLFFGRGIFQYNYGIVPHRKPITVVVGKPISVEKVENPTQEQIENLHAKYVEELKKLYQEHNPKYGNENVKLVIE